MNQLISEKIEREFRTKSGPIRILDAGCGEGSHLNSVRERVRKRTASDLLAVGIDLAKEGIYLASHSGDGIVIKVIPERDYLKELRNILYVETPKRAYSNENTLARFKERFELLEAQRVRYWAALDRELFEPLIQMTPLSWGAEEERLQQIMETDLNEITVDLTVLIGK